MLRRRDDRIEHLRVIRALSACSDRELADVARLSDEVTLPRRCVLMREGAIGHECFLVLEGHADVRIGGRHTARLGPGDIIGEMAILDREPRSATVVATTPLRALVMTELQFAAVCDHCPTVARKVMQLLAHRLREIQAA
jgi:CRP-like cAMP-binding protein